MTGAADGRAPLRRRRWARAGILLLLIPIAGYILYAISKGRERLPPALPPPPQEAVPSGPPKSEMMEFTFTQTKEGAPLYSLTADRLVGIESGVSLLEGIQAFEIHREDGPVRVSADRGRLILEDGNVSQISLDGQVAAVSEAGDRIEAPSAQFYDEDRKITSQGPVRFDNPRFTIEGHRLQYGLDSGSVWLSGPVSILCKEGPLSGWTAISALLTRETESDPLVLSRGVQLRKRDETVSAVELRVGGVEPIDGAVFEGNVRGRLMPDKTGAAENDGTGIPVEFSASRMTLSRKPGARDRAVLLGQARIGGLDADGSLAIEAPEITLEFDSSGRPVHLAASKGAHLERHAGRRSEILDSRELSLQLASGVISEGVATGDVRTRWDHGVTRGEARGEEARLETERIILTGPRSRARQADRSIIADRLEQDRLSGQLKANGQVRVRIDPSSVRAGSQDARSLLPIQESGLPLFIESAEAIHMPGTGVSQFRGRVRAWQGDKSLQSESLTIDEVGELAHAQGDVIMRGIRGNESGLPVSYRITAPEMTYSRPAQEIHFRGDAHYVEAGSDLRAEELLARQSDRRGDLEWIRASGDVRFSSAGRRGTADRAVYRVSGEELVLIGEKRPARVEDNAGRERFQGARLTVDLAADTIVVASGTGDRGRIQVVRPD
jgi:LPS export ABC transporter protein LptC